MIFEIDNKNVHASDAGQGIDNSKDTIVFLHGSGLSHIVWSLTEHKLITAALTGLAVGPAFNFDRAVAEWLKRRGKD